VKSDRSSAAGRTTPGRLPPTSKTQPSSAESIFEILRDVLGGDEALARPLASEVERAVADYPKLESQTASSVATTSQHVDIAEKIQRRSAALLKLLDKSEPRIQDAISRGYLPSTWNPSPDRPSTLGDLYGWTIGRRARESLEAVTRDTNGWRQRARQRRGSRMKNPDRIRLAEWVALKLAAAGVNLTKARGGRFARVLTVVHWAAGLPERDVFRDVAHVLDDPTLAEPLNEARRRGTRRRSK
jgi:hypothetical protein